jgi:hypothetical protein
VNYPEGLVDLLSSIEHVVPAGFNEHYPSVGFGDRRTRPTNRRNKRPRRTPGPDRRWRKKFTATIRMPFRTEMHGRTQRSRRTPIQEISTGPDPGSGHGGGDFCTYVTVSQTSSSNHE